MPHTTFTPTSPVNLTSRMRPMQCLTRLWSGFACIVVLYFCIMEGTSLALADTHDALDRTVTKQQSEQEGILATVTINRKDIFDKSSAFGYQLANRFHRVTRESLIRRELWLTPGDSITLADTQELERNLRSLDLFAQVSVTLVPARRPGMVDLIIDTQDSLSIVFSAGGSFLGGIGEVRFSIGENNLLGLGHKFFLGYSENSQGDLRGLIAYENVLVGATDIYAGVRTGQTEEGEFSAVTLTNRFQNFNDKHFWTMKLEREIKRDDFVESGVSVAQVPRNDKVLILQRQVRKGMPERFLRLGLSLEFQDTHFGQPTGSISDGIEHPDDIDRRFAGAIIALDSNQSFQQVSALDTLRSEQDITLGYSVQLLAGLEHRTTDNASNTAPAIYFRGWSTQALTKHTIFNVATQSSARIDQRSPSRWALSAVGQLFYTGFDNHTLGARLRYSSAFHSDGLPRQQTLGEERGLRGYRAQQFNGEQSMLVNLEHRWRTPFSIAALCAHRCRVWCAYRFTAIAGLKSDSN